MHNFISTYEVKGYANFDGNQNVIQLQNRFIPYEDIECFEFYEKKEVGLSLDPVKMVYGFIFAPALPTNAYISDEDISKGVYICSLLQARIWIQTENDPLIIDFLPKYEPYRPFKIDSTKYRELHATFQSLHEALDKVMVKLYGEDAKCIIDKHLREKNNRIVFHEEISDEVQNATKDV